MLVLARRLNESIIIAEEVRVTVLRISPSRVELGIDADAQVPVDREEIYLRKQAEASATCGKRTLRLSVTVPQLSWK